MQKLKKQVLDVSKVIADVLTSTCLGWSPPQNLLGCSCSAELLQSQCLSVHTPVMTPCGAIPRSQQSSFSWATMPCYVLCFDSVKVVFQDIQDSFWFSDLPGGKRASRSVFIPSRIFLIAGGLGTSILRWMSLASELVAGWCAGNFTAG